MRQMLVLAAALVVGACSAAVSSSEQPSSSTAIGSPSAEATAATTPAPSLSPAPTPLPTTVPPPDSALIETAVAYANDAGFLLDVDTSPVITDEEPSFDRIVLHRVSLALADGNGRPLDVYLDDNGAIRVASDGFYMRPAATMLDEGEIIDAADGHLRQVGIDPTTGTLHVASHSTSHWYLTFDREIAGYRVANAPMGWWLDGDKAYLELRADGSLANLYAIRPDAQPLPSIMDVELLQARLATVAYATRTELDSYDPKFLWVRSNRDHPPERTLSLNYCATHIFANGWEAWCVDAGTGEPGASGSGVD